MDMCIEKNEDKSTVISELLNEYSGIFIFYSFSPQIKKSKTVTDK